MKSYTLELTTAEQEAIHLIGNRYAHGDRLRKLLVENCSTDDPDDGWDCWRNHDMGFIIPEHIAWEISEIINEDQLACFSPALVNKLREFQHSIV